MHSHLKSFFKKYPNWQAMNLNKYSQTLNNPISFHYSFLVSPEPALSAVNYISADLNFVPFAAEWDAPLLFQGRFGWCWTMKHFILGLAL